MVMHIQRLAVCSRVLAHSWLLSFAAATYAETSSVSFAYPTNTAGVPDLVVNVLDMYNIGVPSRGNATISASEYTQFSNQYWTSAIPCHFDLNYQDDFNKGINGPIISVTSIENKSEPTTFSLPQASTTSAPSASPSLFSSSTSARPTTSQELRASSSNVLSVDRGGSNGLSGGTISGIAIGVCIGVLAISGLGWILYHNHRRMKKLEAKMPRDPGDELKPQGVAVAHPYFEASNHQTHEAPPASLKYAQEAPPPSPLELEPFRPLQELPGSAAVEPEAALGRYSAITR
ncbi:hypothetical protein BKA66DRAFT_444049 [Pyrenochaeta sp. MPI-SDFR-AT-0127]|nr:hypothetical protein BKA66DRAFT_444049 [Pyrenochaeta sp. MPI-SDFR-AT-0127]